MNTKALKREWIHWIAILAPVIFILIRWNDFPEKVPMHWNAAGEVDDYGRKASVFMVPGIALAIYLLLLFIPRIDPRKKNYDLFSGAYFTIRLALSLFMGMVSVVITLASLSYKIDAALIIIVGVLLLLLLLGNVFGKIRPNYFVGIRTPWTLNNEEVWMKTHRFTGKIWVAATLVMLVLIWFIPMQTFAMAFIPYILLMVIIPFVYSWKIYREIEKSEK
jgi:uncharacterized membrane protein